MKRKDEGETSADRDRGFAERWNRRTRKIWHLARLPLLLFASVHSYQCTYFFRSGRLGIDSPRNGLALASSAFTIGNQSSGVPRCLKSSGPGRTSL